MKRHAGNRCYRMIATTCLFTYMYAPRRRLWLSENSVCSFYELTRHARWRENVDCVFAIIVSSLNTPARFDFVKVPDEERAPKDPTVKIVGLAGQTRGSIGVIYELETDGGRREKVAFSGGTVGLSSYLGVSTLFVYEYRRPTQAHCSL